MISKKSIAILMSLLLFAFASMATGCRKKLSAIPAPNDPDPFPSLPSVPANPNMTTFRGANYEFDYPSSWVASPYQPPNVEAAFIDPSDKDPINANINLLVSEAPLEPSDMTNSFMQEWFWSISYSIPGLELLNATTGYTDYGLPYAFMDTASPEISIRQFIVFASDENYILTFTATSPLSEENDSLSMQIVNSFRKRMTQL